MNGSPTDGSILLTRPRQLVNRFGTIVFEDLNITNIQKNHHLEKSIADAAWSMFITITESKAEDAGSRVILVNPGKHVSDVLQMWDDRRQDAL